MRNRKNLLLAVFIVMLIPFTGLSNSTRAQSGSQFEFDPERVPWTQLLYSIESFSADVTAQVQLESLPAAITDL